MPSTRISASPVTGHRRSRRTASALASCSMASNTGPMAAAISRTSTERVLRPRAASGAGQAVHVGAQQGRVQGGQHPGPAGRRSVR